MTERMAVEVAYARPERQKIVRLTLPAGSNALQAVQASGLAGEFADIDMANLKLGIFSKAIKPDTVLREGDRVELYRPLQADPKAVRRQRAEAGLAMKKGGD